MYRRCAKSIAFSLWTLVAVAGFVSNGFCAQKAPSVQSPHKKLKLECETCHVPVAFDEIQFDHGTTRFTLDGAHESAACLLCHSIEDFSIVEKACVSCHEDVHLGELGAVCEKCHVTSAWNIFDGEEIHSRTNFPLIGRHLLIDCESCHHGQLANSFSRTSSRCVDCHQNDYLATTNPNHVAGGFSTECEDCHRMTGFVPATMPNHDPFFPIFSGTHRGQWDDCAICHTDPGNSKIFSCLNCHEHRQDAMDPAHRDMPGYSYASTACYDCHPTGERGNFLAHDAEFFPIYSGTHRNQWAECLECHTDVANSRAFSCLTCHEHRRDAMDPAHVGMSGYSYASNACYNCHPTGVKGNFVDHDVQFFPIYSGTHNNQWAECLECHTDPGNPNVFSCLTCHEHRQDAMDPVHNGMPGYSYASNACYNCHPTGESGNFLEHDAQFFPIYSGTHRAQWTECLECHTDPANGRAFSCLICHEHRQEAMDPVHIGMAGYSYVSSACYNCHPTGERGNFLDHDVQFFPIYSGTHNNQWAECLECHVDPTNASVFSCLSCHVHRQDAMDPFHAGIPGYSYSSTACYNCHPTGNSGQFTAHDGDFFPIYSGVHRGRWDDCATCHEVATNKSIFTCFNCHEHNQPDMDNQHRGVGGYSYSSDRCLDCHPNGRR